MTSRSHNNHLNSSHPQVMGILNITPNSFSTVGRFLSATEALLHAEKMVAEGAAIIDVGGEATNPGVHPIVSLQEELDRIIPVVEKLAQQMSVPISIDTSKPEVMREAISHGASFINDVRALQNPGALEIIAETKVPVCLMHMAFPEGNTDNTAVTQPTSTVKQNIDSHACERDDVKTIISTVKHFLQTRIDACLNAGIAREKIVIDPGIGSGNFGKNTAQNLQLIAQLETFKTFGLPILIGVSRKSFIGELLNLPVAERLNGSLAATVMAVSNGANIIRAHDVKATVEAVKVAAAVLSYT